jgi:prepilin-type N-terminal cleavage/methylation domain-containing protein
MFNKSISNRALNNQSGFTLIEIVAAVVILSLGLSILLSMQTRYAESYFKERNRFRAVLFAQYLMTLVEVAPQAPAEGTKDETLSNVLQDAGYFDAAGDQLINSQSEGLQNWRFFQRVTSINVPPLEDILRKIEMTVRWGEGADEEFQLVYFIRPKPELN